MKHVVKQSVLEIIKNLNSYCVNLKLKLCAIGPGPMGKARGNGRGRHGPPKKPKLKDNTSVIST